MIEQKRSRKPVGQRIHDWLEEPEGKTFEFGKWRFWFIAVAGLQLVNAVLTALIFQHTGQSQNYTGAIILGVGALVGWITVGALHYSGVAKLSKGVSRLDSISLIFVVLHFAFLMWCYTRLATVQSAEAKYEAAALAYNSKSEKLSSDDVEIAKAGAVIAAETTKAARFNNDAAYQLRQAAKYGARISAANSAQSSGALPSVTRSKIELEKPDKPEQSTAKFLESWDGLIRVANFGELLLCALTLIFIRNKTASERNQFPARPQIRARIFEDEFPPELDAQAAENLGPAPRENFTRKKETAKKHASSISEVVAFDPEGLNRLRQTLKDISFGLPGFSFKSYVRGDAVWILKMRANKGTQETAASAKATLQILDDALKMPPAQFRERVEKFLRQNQFGF